MPVIYTLSICGRLTLNLHNLNNEGTEGNQQLTRMVNVVVRRNGTETIEPVNAVSGDMFKHIQAEHLHRLALEHHAQNAQLFPLSAGARAFDANRINTEEDAALLDRAGNNNVALLTAILQHCAVTDLEGTLVTAGNRSLPRKSCVEFGWVVGVPELTKSDTLFHVKYDPRGRGEAAGAEQVTGQAIFHRPVNSGVYAAICNAELYRIGRNDISLEYVVGQESRLLRARALLQSIWYTFVQTKGAQRNTQLPHATNFEGALAYSSTACVPAPTASALNPEFLTEIDGAAAALNRLHPGAITVRRFATQAEFGSAMADLTEALQVL